ncbi:hypothetical protein, partial [Lutispora sp.]|uniref:hypothetical protein n=1 Tax=Lutispora sp. TaxID=2828727 RepID=UPI003569FEE3
PYIEAESASYITCNVMQQEKQKKKAKGTKQKGRFFLLLHKKLLFNTITGHKEHYTRHDAHSNHA